MRDLLSIQDTVEAQPISSNFPFYLTLIKSTTCYENIDYLQYFLQQLCVPGNTLANVSALLQARYSTWSNPSLLEFMLSNPAWTGKNMF